MKRAMVLLCLMLCCTVLAPRPTRASVESEKFKVFNHFFEVIGAEAQYNQMLAIITTQFSRGFSAAISKQVEKDAKISPENKDKVKALVSTYMQNAMQKMRSRFSKEIPFSDLVKNVYYPVYEKHFTVAELKEVIAFYESPVGKKFVKQTPALMQESVSLLNSQYNAKMLALSQQVAQEELAGLKRELDKITGNTH